MSTETGDKAGSVIMLIGIIVTIAGLLIDSKFMYSGVGVIVIFIGRAVKEYF